MDITYTQIERLGVKINEGEVEHILHEDLEKVLSKDELDKFSEYFGIQTCLLTNEGKVGMYPWDVEAVLVRMFTKRLTGTQLHWD